MLFVSCLIIEPVFLFYFLILCPKFVDDEVKYSLSEVASVIVTSALQGGNKKDAKGEDDEKKSAESSDTNQINNSNVNNNFESN